MAWTLESGIDIPTHRASLQMADFVSKGELKKAGASLASRKESICLFCIRVHYDLSC